MAKKILNPLTGNMEPIQSVLYSLSGQEGCDGEPYDQMYAAAEYIDLLEVLKHKVKTNSMKIPMSTNLEASKNVWAIVPKLIKQVLEKIPSLCPDTGMEEAEGVILALSKLGYIALEK